MSDFTSDFWALYVAVLTIVSIVGCWVLLHMQTTRPAKDAAVETTGHVWDEDLREWNNALPNWWRWLFYLTMVFALVYLAFYPGLGIWGGKLQWSSAGQYRNEQARADALYGPLYAKYLGMDIREVAADPAALAIGQNLYLNNCAQCHAADARGGKGFPNLADGDWLYGGEPKLIEQSIAGGRNGIMPPLGPVLGADGVQDVASYVMSLSGGAHDAARAARGKEKFAQICAACHGPEGKGNPLLGAPNLTDKTWLHGGSEASIVETIAMGRRSVMPAWHDMLGDAKVHVLAAYVWSLSNEPARK